MHIVEKWHEMHDEVLKKTVKKSFCLFFISFGFFMTTLMLLFI